MARGQNAVGGRLATVKATKPSSRQAQKTKHFAERKQEQAVNSLKFTSRLSGHQLDTVRLDFTFAPEIVKLPPREVSKWLSDDEETYESTPRLPRSGLKMYGGRNRAPLTDSNVQSILDYESLIDPVQGGEPELDDTPRVPCKPSPSISSPPPEQPPPSPTPHIQLDPHPEINYPNMSSSPVPPSIYENECTIATPLFACRYPFKPPAAQRRMTEAFYHCLETPDDLLHVFARTYKDKTLSLLKKIMDGTGVKVAERQQAKVKVEVESDEERAEDEEARDVLEFCPPTPSPEVVQ